MQEIQNTKYSYDHESGIGCQSYCEILISFSRKSFNIGDKPAYFQVK